MRLAPHLELVNVGVPLDQQLPQRHHQHLHLAHFPGHQLNLLDRSLQLTGLLIDLRLKGLGRFLCRSVIGRELGARTRREPNNKLGTSQRGSVPLYTLNVSIDYLYSITIL